MKQAIDKEIEKRLKHTPDMSKETRITLDNTYQSMLKEPLVERPIKKMKRWSLPTALVVIPLLFVIFTNKQVLGAINEMLGFTSSWRQDVSTDLWKANDSSVTANDVTVTVTKVLSTRQSFAFDYEIMFQEGTKVDKVDFMNMSFRVKNGDGTYVFESLNDLSDYVNYPTQLGFEKMDTSFEKSEESHTLKGNQTFIGATEYTWGDEGLLNAKTGQFPQLKGAIIEIDELYVGRGDGKEAKTIKGPWHIPVESVQKEDEVIQMMGTNETGDIRLNESFLTSTYLYVSFDVPSLMNEELELIHFYVLDNKGRTYRTDSFHLDNQTIRGYLPITTNGHDVSDLKLVVTQGKDEAVIGEVRLKDVEK